MIRVGMHEAKSNLSKLVQRAIDGEDVEIMRNGKVVAKIVPVEERAPSLNDVRGIWKGTADIGDPFEPLPDWLLDAFEGTFDTEIP